MVVFLNVVVSQGPPNDVITNRNGPKVLFLCRGVGRVLLLQGLVARSRTIVVCPGASVRGADNEQLFGFCRRFIMIITSVFYFPPRQLPNFVRDKDEDPCCFRAVRRTNDSFRFRSRHAKVSSEDPFVVRLVN